MHSSTMRTAHSLPYTGRGGLCPWLSLSDGGSLFKTGVSVQSGLCQGDPPSPCEQTNRCKNSTFPQLRLRPVINVALSHQTLFLMCSADTDAPEILIS